MGNIVLELRSGCRLHFGLMELSEGAERRYAGLGIMLQEPSIRLRSQVKLPMDACSHQPTKIQDGRPFPADAEASLQNQSASTAEYRERIADWRRKHAGSPTVEILKVYPFHCGLGTGTQLASLLATLQLLQSDPRDIAQCWQPIKHLLPVLNVLALAQLSGRGCRSAIGLQGFLTGGLILDQGFPPSAQSRFVDSTSHHCIPDQWRFVTIRTSDTSGIYGSRESRLINELGARPNPNQPGMWLLANEACKAAQTADFATFSDRLEGYLNLASNLFAAAQGGRYNGPSGEVAARCARSLGLRAVGQSSWGPTIFGVAEGDDQAQEVANRLRQRFVDWHVQVSAVALQGAQVRQVSSVNDS